MGAVVRGTIVQGEIVRGNCLGEDTQGVVVLGGISWGAIDRGEVVQWGIAIEPHDRSHLCFFILNLFIAQKLHSYIALERKLNCN